MNVAVVVPTIRQDCAEKFLSLWAAELKGARLIFVEDNPKRTFRLGAAEHYCHADIDRDLANSWIVPRRTSACRSYGIWLAWKDGADVIWTLDDDCYPEPGRQGDYLNQVRSALAREVPPGEWVSTLPPGFPLYPRGYPYQLRDEKRPVMMNHGLWSNVPDLDGLTQKANPDVRLPPARECRVIPYGAFFPMCVMNLAWRRDMTPALYMLLMGQDAQGRKWGYDRFDDIWAGLFVKRITDHLGWAITSGPPSVHHSKASNADTNIRLEAAGIAVHEEFWKHIRDAPLTAKTVTGCYLELAEAVATFSAQPYWPRLAWAMRCWAHLFGE